MLGVTGQRPKHKESCTTQELMPIFTMEELKDPTSMANQSHLSGKADGAVVAVLEGKEAGIYMASGSEPDSRWVQLSTLGDAAEEEFVVKSFDDMVDFEMGVIFNQYFQVTGGQDRIPSQVIQTPVKLVDGSWVFHCRLVSTFEVTPKAEAVLKDTILFDMKLKGITDRDDQYYPIDHASFQPFAITGMAFGAVEAHNAKTNNINVRLHINSAETRGTISFNFAFEWTAPIGLEGDTGEKLK